MPAHLLTLLARALIALVPRLFVYVAAMVAGAGATAAAEQIAASKSRRKKDHAEKMRIEAHDRALKDIV